MKALVGAFNQEKALVGAFSVIMKSSWTFVQPSFRALDLTAIVQYVQYVVKPEEDAAGQYDSLQVDPGVETVEMLLDLWKLRFGNLKCVINPKAEVCEDKVGHSLSSRIQSCPRVDFLNQKT